MSLDPWRPLVAGEHPVFRDQYSATVLADGPTPWGELRMVPTLHQDERRVDWCLDGEPVVSLRMTELRFGRPELVCEVAFAD